MSIIVDELEGDVIDSELAEMEQEASPELEPKKIELPQKLQGKSADEIADMYMNLEREFGRKNNELGELRKHTDELLNLQKLKEQAPAPKPEVHFDDILDNPSRAIETVIDPKLKELNEKVERINQANSLKEFESKHPNYKKDAQSKEFADWVTASPYRVRLYNQADAMDFMAADELMSSYNEYKTILQESHKTEVEVKKQTALKQAAAESGTSGEVKKKIYRRSELVRMKMYEPDKYEAHYDEIMAAYAEGRVK